MNQTTGVGEKHGPQFHNSRCLAGVREAVTVSHQGPPPVVSILTCVRSETFLLERGVESVRGQLFAEWELLLIDSGCTCGDTDSVDRRVAGDHRIRFVQVSEPEGQVDSLNLGLREARGQWIAYLDSGIPGTQY